MIRKTLYLDESGDHDLKRVDPAYPVFVLGGVLVDDDYDHLVNEPALDNFKKRWFGTTNVNLHTADIIGNRKAFVAFKDEKLRASFFNDLGHLVNGLDISVMACAIHKEKHRRRYGPSAWDPYEYALMVLVERLCLEFGDVRNGASIVAEQRSPELDVSFNDTWNDLTKRGTVYITSRTINHRISSCDLEPKSNNVAGLELADLVVSRIGRYLTSKPHTGILNYKSTIHPKLLKNGDGQVLGYGLVMIPKP